MKVAFAVVAGISLPFLLIGGTVLIAVVLKPLIDLYTWGFVLFTPLMLVILVGALIWERRR